MEALLSVMSLVKKSSVKEENYVKYVVLARELMIKNVRSHVR